MTTFFMERFQGGLGANATSPNDFHIALSTAFLMLFAVGIIARCIYIAYGMMCDGKEASEIFKALRKRMCAAVCAACVASVLAAVEGSFK